MGKGNTCLPPFTYTLRRCDRQDHHKVTTDRRGFNVTKRNSWPSLALAPLLYFPFMAIFRKYATSRNVWAVESWLQAVSSSYHAKPKSHKYSRVQLKGGRETGEAFGQRLTCFTTCVGVRNINTFLWRISLTVSVVPLPPVWLQQELAKSLLIRKCIPSNQAGRGWAHSLSEGAGGRLRSSSELENGDESLLFLKFFSAHTSIPGGSSFISVRGGRGSYQWHHTCLGVADAERRKIYWRLTYTGLPSRKYFFAVSRSFHRVQSPKGLKAAQGDQMLSLFLF